MKHLAPNEEQKNDEKLITKKTASLSLKAQPQSSSFSLVPKASVRQGKE